MTQLGGHAIYLTNDVVLGARESVRDVARNLERFVDGIVVRTGPARGRRGARGPGRDPGDQRPDPARASLPGAGRPVHDPRSASAASRASSSRSSATATTSTTRSRCSAPRWASRSASPIPPGYGPNERIVARADGARRRQRRPARRSARPARGRPRRRRRLHGRLDVDGPGGRDGGAPRRVRAATRSTTRCSTPPAPARSRCTACRPTAARRSRPR